ncbi:MAG: hypothetical protein IK001_04315 [Lachnospiraceae bacterium]|nr:hypothetical protein [Lachnospiraceae bacterium]
MMGEMIIPRELLFLLFVLCYYIAVVSGAFFIKSFWTKRSVSYRVIYFLLTIAAFSLIRFFADDGEHVSFVLCMYGIPALSGAFLTVRLIAKEYGDTRVGPESVKECVDRLPTGICCYFEGGQVKLVNDLMSRLCIELTGERLSDGEWFDRSLKELSIAEEDDTALVRMGDGKYYSFRKQIKDLDGRPLKEIIATDVTREYRLTAELKEKEEQVAALNVRLKELSEESLKTAIEKEVLAAKVRVHDDLGRVILLARRCLNLKTDDNFLSLEKTAEEVRKQAILMLSESPDEWRRDYGYVFRTAKQLGMKLKVQGKIPQGERSRRLAVSALNCAILNSARHAGADQINVKCEKVRDEASGTEYYEMSISDNVNFQVEKVEEKGGLKSLRNELEAEGGSLIIRVGQGVALYARMPAD